MSRRPSFRSCRSAFAGTLAALLLLTQLIGLHHALAHRAALAGVQASSAPAGQHAPTPHACLAYDAALQAAHLPTADVRLARGAAPRLAPHCVSFTSRHVAFAAHFPPRGPPAPAAA